MWEEEPSYQKANYRFLGFLTATLVVGVAIWSAWEREWMMLGYWVLGLLAILLALAFYAAAVWLFGHSIASMVRVFKSVFHKKP
jgi:4-amino-4-deoxy-L-arabinose transferase-like glycosyltransferase